MFAATPTEYASWHVANSNDKKRAPDIISRVLGEIPYETSPRERVVLPARQKRGRYREPEDSDLYVRAIY